MDSHQLLIAFYEIINGKSPIYNKILGDVYIKHTSYLESLNIENQYLLSLNEALDKGLPRFLDREKIIISDKLWSLKEENSIKDTKSFVQTLKTNLSTDYLFSRRNIIKKEIYDAEQRLDSLLLKKDHLIGSTAERYAQEKSYHYKICNSFYRDSELKDKIIFNDLFEEEYELLINSFNDYHIRTSSKIIKVISISSFFINLFQMCSDNAYQFYGKAIVELTSHQSELFLYALYFKNHMKHFSNRIPDNITEPDDMIEWFEINQNVEKSGILKADDESGGAGSVVGATKKDYEMMGVEPIQMLDINKKIKEAGGKLDKEALFKMQR